MESRALKDRGRGEDHRKEEEEARREANWLWRRQEEADDDAVDAAIAIAKEPAATFPIC